MIHELKTLSNFYEDVKSGKKTFEVRKNDRDYRIGDYLALNEIEPNEQGIGGNYTGNAMLVRITYILNNPEYCKQGYVVMGIELVKACCALLSTGILELGTIQTNRD